MEIIVYRPGYKKFKYLENVFDYITYKKLQYRLSELMQLGVNDIGERELALQRAIKACLLSGIAIDQNFRSLYLATEAGLVRDWMMSSFARNLVLFNIDPAYSLVAKLQTELIHKL